MKGNEETYDTLSVGVVAIVAIICVLLLAVGLTPTGTMALEAETPTYSLAGQAYGSIAVPVGTQFDISLLDFNKDGILDFYDVQDCLAGTTDNQACDINRDGFVDAADGESFTLLVTRLYDYDNDRSLTRDDPLFLRDILYGAATCDTDHVCDVDGDGFITSEDLALYTSLLFNYDLR